MEVLDTPAFIKEVILASESSYNSENNIFMAAYYYFLAMGKIPVGLNIKKNSYSFSGPLSLIRKVLIEDKKLDPTEYFKAYSDIIGEQAKSLYLQSDWLRSQLMNNGIASRPPSRF
jgi:hypothetical protein